MRYSPATVAAMAGLVLVCSGCRPRAPTTPTTAADASAISPVAFERRDLVGRWAGELQIVTCTGDGCKPFITQSPSSFSLAVREDGTGFAALLAVDRIFDLVAEISGTRRANKSIVFTGFRQSRTSSVSADIDAFEVRLDPNTGLAGEFHVRWRSETEDATFTGRILSAHRQKSALNRTVHGEWKGNVLVTGVDSCTSGGCGMRLGGSRIIRLTLQQMGEMVSGEAQISSRVPVSGRLSGSSALLGGALPTVEPCSRPSFLNDLTCAEEFRNIAISLDPLGRLVGTLEFSRDWWAGGSTSLPSHHTQAVRGELIDMIRQ